MSQIESVKVAVRVRPFSAREKAAGSKCIVRMKGAVTTLVNPKTQEERDFAFDFSYWSHDGFETDEAGYNAKAEGSSKHGADYASQQTVYDNLGAPMLENVMAGYNCTMFAYGQTGAGKSYSFVGYGANKVRLGVRVRVGVSPNPSPNPNPNPNPNPSPEPKPNPHQGILPIVSNQIFEQVHLPYISPISPLRSSSRCARGRARGTLTIALTLTLGAPFSTAAEQRSWFRANFPRADPAALDALYASDAAADEPWGAAAHAYTDGQYLCPTARSARWLAAAAVAPNPNPNDNPNPNPNPSPSPNPDPDQVAEVYTYRLEYAPQMYGTLGELAYWQVWCRG